MSKLALAATVAIAMLTSFSSVSTSVTGIWAWVGTLEKIGRAHV